MQKPSIFDIFRGNPLLTIGTAIFAVVFIIAVVIGLLNQNNNSTTGGDVAAPDSPATMSYYHAPYSPSRNLNATNLLLADVAFFARKTLKEYNPKKQPGVLFIVSSASTALDGSIELKGKFDKSSHKVTIHMLILKNDRIKSSIIDTNTNSNIDSTLPSTSALNAFIAKLPITSNHYAIDYGSTKQSIDITIPEQNPAFITEAQQAIAAQLGVSVDEVKGIKSITYTYPTNTDYGTTLQPAK